jgi:hypothetical protein
MKSKLVASIKSIPKTSSEPSCQRPNVTDAEAITCCQLTNLPTLSLLSVAIIPDAVKKELLQEISRFLEANMP